MYSLVRPSYFNGTPIFFWENILVDKKENNLLFTDSTLEVSYCTAGHDIKQYRSTVFFHSEFVYLLPLLSLAYKHELLETVYWYRTMRARGTVARE